MAKKIVQEVNGASYEVMSIDELKAEKLKLLEARTEHVMQANMNQLKQTHLISKTKRTLANINRLLALKSK